MVEYTITRPFTTWCEAGRNCKKYGTDECCDPCPRQRDYFWLLDNSNLPENYKFPQKLINYRDEGDFEKYLSFNEYIKTETENFVNAGLTMFLCGPDSETMSIMAAKFMRYYMHEIAYGNNFRNACWYVNVPKYFSKVQKKIFGDSYNSDPELILHRKMLETCPLVLWDNFSYLITCNKNIILDDIWGILCERTVQGYSNLIVSKASYSLLVERHMELENCLYNSRIVQTTMQDTLFFENKQIDSTIKQVEEFKFVD